MISESYKNRLKILAGLFEKFNFDANAPQNHGLHKYDIPDKYFYHVSAPFHRESIEQNGLIPQITPSTKEMGFTKPSIFVSDDINKLFGSGHGDVWQIDKHKLNNKFLKDPYNKNWYYTLDIIPIDSIKLIKKL